MGKSLIIGIGRRFLQGVSTNLVILLFLLNLNLGISSQLGWVSTKRFHHWTPTIRWVWKNHCSGRPILEVCHFYPDFKGLHCQTSRRSFLEACCQVLGRSKQYCKLHGSSILEKILDQVIQALGVESKILH